VKQQKQKQEVIPEVTAAHEASQNTLLVNETPKQVQNDTSSDGRKIDDFVDNVLAPSESAPEVKH